MKYLFYIFLLFNISNVNLTHAQQLPKQGDNLPNPRLKRIAGTWVSIYGSDTLRIKLSFENIKLPVLDLTADVLIGYTYYKNGHNIIINDIKYSNKTYNDNLNEGKKRASIFGLNEPVGDITGSIPDGQTSQSFRYIFTPSADLNTMTAVLQVTEKIYVNEKRGKGYPDEMIFKRE